MEPRQAQKCEVASSPMLFPINPLVGVTTREAHVFPLQSHDQRPVLFSHTQEVGSWWAAEVLWKWLNSGWLTISNRRKAGSVITRSVWRVLEVVDGFFRLSV